MTRYFVIAWILLSGGFHAQAQSDSGQLALEARKVLKTYCFKCHGAEFKVPRLNMLDLDLLVEKPADGDPYVLPGNPESSMIWQRMGQAEDMPPEEHPQPSDEEKAIVEKWIREGAAAAVEPDRKRIEVKDVLAAITAHLNAATVEGDSPADKRYFSIHHLHNNSSVSVADLRLYRAALSKALNSLSSKRSIVVPKAIDDQETVFAIDLNDYGWDVDRWKSAVKTYPYGVRWRSSDLNRVAGLINQQMGGALNGADSVPYIRADWFIRTATRPPVYELLLELPNTLGDLEKKIGVDVQEDFRIGSRALQRAGFSGSGVSRHNRLVDRHSGNKMSVDYYYKSYDFAKSSGRGAISLFPLGPKFEGDPFRFDSTAFEHDGGEVLWSLPNGLQGYMLGDAKGNRLPGDEAPIKIVRDVNEFAGTPVITNGISCIGCHKKGIIDYSDNIQNNLVFGGERGEKIQEIFIKDEQLRPLLQADRKLFTDALTKCISPFLKEGEDYGNGTPFERIEDTPEPVTTVSRWYDRDLTSVDAAAELDMELNDFTGIVRNNNRIKQLGVAPLGLQLRVPRQLWDSLEETGVSVFQRLFTETGAGSATSLDD